MGVNNGAFNGIAAGNVFIVQVKMDLCSVWERRIGYNYPMYHKRHVLSESQCVKVGFIIAWVDA
jgi:hypothetical protein